MEQASAPVAPGFGGQRRPAAWGDYQARPQELDMKAKLAQFWNEEEGITALEYGLIAGTIAVALVAALATFTGALGDLFTSLQAKLAAAST
ncbi:Flp family type IVb pilin [Achromobacter xylosoxidans]|uniref:Flp family type IVb pilin n=1 Tax=Alcaligenes xylosoxydans xylosoxydans TaxID=85698 RepID=UPI003F4CEB57